MEALQHSIYQFAVEYALSTKTGNEFQALFVAVAASKWGSDFEPRRPQGKLGDRKCDGYHVPTGTVFQCYAPRTIDARKLKAKIREDFNGARGHFGQSMKAWTIVHNDREGLATEPDDEIKALRQANQGISIAQWGFAVLLREIMDLPEKELRVLFPAAPSAHGMRRIQFEEIEGLVRILESEPATPDLTTPVAPSPSKIEHNKLSDHIRAFLRQGELPAAKFGEYFSSESQVDAGNRIAEKFRRQYLCRRDAREDPDQIFFGLVDLAGGLDHTRARANAVLGLMCYLFHKCDIFEDIPKDAYDTAHEASPI